MPRTKSKPILLDTLTWINYLIGKDTLTQETITLIDKAAQNGNLFISIATVWETAEMANYNILKISQPIHHWIPKAINRSSTQVLQVTNDIAIESYSLPLEEDDLSLNERLIIATARLSELTLVTSNPALQQMAEEHLIKVA